MDLRRMCSMFVGLFKGSTIHEIQWKNIGMEETVRSLLQNPDSLEGPNVDPLNLMKAYKDKLLEEMWKQQDSLEGPPASTERPNSLDAISKLEGNSDETKNLLERLRALEVENSALSTENDNQRKQYERCLDEVANQVVQALLTQKDLKEECVKLRTRVFDLEQQNRILSVLFQQRVKTSSNSVSQEAQRNGKAGVPPGRWPSLLSLTCPRSSASGSEASLSSACSEYSSGSHTWAEGCGSSKQSAMNREKRMSAGSMSSNSSAPTEPADLGWKEGHILKGLKRLQMCSTKGPSSLASVKRHKDCTTSNEGIYSLGVKFGPQRPVPKQAVPTGKQSTKETMDVVLVSDSDDADDESNKSQSREPCDQSKKQTLCSEGADTADLGLLDVETSPAHYSSNEEPVRLNGNVDISLLPFKDTVFVEGPTLKPGVSPTESPTHTAERKCRDSLEQDKKPGVKNVNDRNDKNNQELSGERKSRLDYIKKQQDRVTFEQSEEGSKEASLPIQHSAAQALSWVAEARQRSASMDPQQWRAKTSQSAADMKDYAILESKPKKPKPQACDSARKAFILRSRSADGGPEQHKQLHSPLHQKLIKVHHRSKGQSSSPGHSIPKSSLSKVPVSSKAAMHKAEKGENIAGSRYSGSLESVGQGSPLSSPEKQSKAFKIPVFNEAPKGPLPASKLPSRSDPGSESSVSNYLSSTPLKQKCQDQHSEASHSELRSPSPPLPPDRTTSLLIRPGYDSLPKTHKVIQPHNAITTKTSSTSTKHQSNQSLSTGQMKSQVTNTTQDPLHMSRQIDLEVIKSPKRVPAKVCHSLSTSIPIHASVDTDSHQLSRNLTAVQSQDENQRASQIPQQGIGEAQVSELLPPGHVLCHGAVPNPLHYISKEVKTSLSVDAKLQDPSPVQGNNTFLVLGRYNTKSDANTVSKVIHTVDKFNPDNHSHQTMHGVNAAIAKDKARRKIETKCSSLDSDPCVQPAVTESGVMLDWGFDEDGWLFKRSVSVSTRPPIKPVMGMNGAKARSQSFGTRYMDRPNFNRSGKVRTHIKTHSGSSLNYLGDVFQGSMSCSNSYHCPMNRSLLNNFLMEEGLPVPSHLGSSSERLQSIKNQREQARRLQIEQQLSSAFGEPVVEEPERQNTITTIEEKVMLGIEENLHKSQEQERTTETKVKSGSSLANWFGFRKSKLPAPNLKKSDPSKAKEEKKEVKTVSLIGGKQTKTDKKKDKKKSDGKESSAGRRESHDAVRVCLSMPMARVSHPFDMQGHTDICGETETKIKRMSLMDDNGGEYGAALMTPSQDQVIGSGCQMRTLDSGIGTFPLPDSSSFLSSILHLFPKSTSDQARNPPSAPSSSSEEVSPSSLPCWKVPSGWKDHNQSGVPNSLSDLSVTLVQSVAFHQPNPSLSQPIVTCANVCDSQSRLPRLASGGIEPKKMAKTRPSPRQQKERTGLQMANCKNHSL